jgi:D-3-phosphoglycerate dehydrogenase
VTDEGAGNTGPRVLVPEKIADAGVALLRVAGIVVDERPGLSADELMAIIKDYEGLIVRSATKVTKDVIDAGERLQVVGRAGIGVDNVDVDAATRRGIVVLNTPQGNIVSTAEHTVALILALAKRIPAANASLKSGEWAKSKFMGTELQDKTLGIIGFGRVGTLVAQRCHGFGMHVIARDQFVAPQRFQRAGVEQVELDELLERADVISMHVVLTPETRHMIGEAELEKCRPGVLIVNASRGGVVDEDALARAIKAGKVGGAGLDVFESEPLKASPLFDLDEVVVTPHIAGQTSDAQDKAGVIAAEQVLLALRGEFVPNAVNLDASGELSEFLRPFLPLASKLGRLAGALAGDKVSEIEVSYLGQVGEEDTRVLTLSVLRGYLQPALHEPVTYVNAPILAADRGIGYAERKSAAPEEYLNLVRVTVRREGTPVTVAGILARKANVSQLVEVDGRTLAIDFSRYMVLIRYEDRPGVIHKMSGPLAAAGIGIKNMHVGEPPPGEKEAISVLSVDKPIPSDVFEQMIEAAGITSGRFVSLDGD